MSRPKIWKHVCRMPKVNRFTQVEDPQQENRSVVLSVEEYEVMRLIDHENMTQQECAAQMEVSRPTVQILYDKARKKLADFLVNGGSLVIEGGSYKLCTREHSGCGCSGRCTCGEKTKE